MSRKRVRGFSFLVLLLSVWLTSQVLHAAVPHLIRYQGVLVDTNNQPLSGSYTLTLRLYDAPTGGTKLWEETQPNIPVTNGTFTLLLGSVTSLDGVSFDGDRYLALQLQGEPEMAPRQRITSVPFALTAERLTDAQSVLGPISISGNNVGIGTTNPNQLLEIASGADIRIRLNSTGATPGLGLELAESGVPKAYIQRETGNKLAFYSGGGAVADEKMVILDSGNVGIGTTGPASTLDVNGKVAEHSNALVPAGAIILWTGSSCPGGYTRFSAMDGKFLVSGSSYSPAAGGSNTHTHGAGSYAGPSHTHDISHTHTVGQTPENGPPGYIWPNDKYFTTSGPNPNTSGPGGTGSITGTSAAADSRPEFATVLLCQKD